MPRFATRRFDNLHMGGRVLFSKESDRGCFRFFDLSDEQDQRERIKDLQTAQSEWVPDAVISDTHFFHDRIIALCGRKNPATDLVFSGISEMNDLIRERWNEGVGVYDEVLHTGDLAFFYRDGATRRFIESLNGKITLVAGNHDKWKDTLKKIAECRNVKAIHGRISCRGVLFTHKPVQGIESPNCHGHMHDSPDLGPFHFNASVERHGYRPIPSCRIFKWGESISKQKEQNHDG